MTGNRPRRNPRSPRANWLKRFPRSLQTERGSDPPPLPRTTSQPGGPAQAPRCWSRAVGLCGRGRRVTQVGAFSTGSGPSTRRTVASIRHPMSRASCYTLISYRTALFDPVQGLQDGGRRRESAAGCFTGSVAVLSGESGLTRGRPQPASGLPRELLPRHRARRRHCHVRRAGSGMRRCAAVPAWDAAEADVPH
jgi:hypothetical protein